MLHSNLKMSKYQRTTTELDKKLEKIINEKFSTSYMSNKKWVKLIDVFVANSELVKRVEIKKVLEEKIGFLSVPSELKFEFDYWNIGFEGATSFGGWLLYKEIEFIRFPSKFQNGNLVEDQNLEEIKVVIDNVGLFELVKQNEELILFCYR